MIVAFENNVVCSDEKVRDYLLAHHADLKEDQDEDALCLAVSYTHLTLPTICSV